ncbi:putative short-chain dehydrogenase/reductase SDR, NAD(P)-binding domain superfamily [Helianthus anomalus]
MWFGQFCQFSLKLKLFASGSLWFQFYYHFGPKMKSCHICLIKSCGGRIICVTSSLVVALRPGTGPYAASKAAVEAMVKILAKELKGTRITANCVAPGAIATNLLFEGISEAELNIAVDQSPFGRLGEPEDVAPVVGFLASDAAEWVNGQIVRVTGGDV